MSAISAIIPDRCFDGGSAESETDACFAVPEEAAIHGRTFHQSIGHGAKNMNEQLANIDPPIRRAHARRTALIVGMAGVAICLVAIGEVVSRR